eukprot:CAMPEP_0117523260 /NCGR_PEP_ID=MMETSP0784-20121206/34636_1 /TAXON_ID=39447 /ORGANISM="" /LENGTH=372 /DNA_ID=CAMNT_0005319367 /DNA_START=133 /DNA_END=1251 /DNA_ORIENTATION=+
MTACAALGLAVAAWAMLCLNVALPAFSAASPGRRLGSCGLFGCSCQTGVVARRFHRCCPRASATRIEAENSFAEGQQGDVEDDGMSRIQVSELEVGQELSGIVNSVRPFGCFVDVGADRDGLVHLSMITEGFVESIEDYVVPGQEVKVWVTDVTEEGKLGLTMVQGRGRKDGRDTSMEFEGFEKVPSDQWLTGTVQQITDFGLYVSVANPFGGPTAKGLVHISQIKDQFVEHPAEEAEVGQEVRVRVIEVDPGAGKLRLSMREPRLTDGPSGRPSADLISAFDSVPRSEWLKGKVHHTVPFGIFVEVAVPSGGGIVQGLVHVTEIRDGFVDDPAAEVEVGQEVDVRVISVAPAAGRLSFSMKPEAVEGEEAT